MAPNCGPSSRRSACLQSPRPPAEQHPAAWCPTSITGICPSPRRPLGASGRFPVWAGTKSCCRHRCAQRPSPRAVSPGTAPLGPVARVCVTRARNPCHPTGLCAAHPHHALRADVAPLEPVTGPQEPATSTVLFTTVLTRLPPLPSHTRSSIHVSVPTEKSRWGLHQPLIASNTCPSLPH